MSTNFNLALSAIITIALSSIGIMRTAHADESDIKVINKSYIIKLGKSRVFYPEGSEGVEISVYNPQSQPVLIATKFFAENREDKGDYSPTTPVFLLKPNHSGEVSFIRTNPDYPKDRESINWACIKSVPPQQDYTEKSKTVKEATLTISKTAKICVQVRFRPKGISAQSHITAKSLSWKKHGNTLIASNLTPYYISLKKLVGIDGDLNLNNSIIAPFSHVNITSKNFNGKSVSWIYVNDSGANSEALNSPVTS